MEESDKRKYVFRPDRKQTKRHPLHSVVERRTEAKRAKIKAHYRALAIEANCDPADGYDIDLIVNSMAKMALMQGHVEGGGVRQTGGQSIDFMVPMLLLFSRDVNGFFQNAGGNVDAIINGFAGWWSTLSDCVRRFWDSIFGTGQDHNAAATALLELGGEQQPEREQNTWNYIMEMIGSATTSAMEGATAFGTAARTKTQPYIDQAKENPVQFGAMVAAMGSNIYLFGGTFVGGAMWLLNFLQVVPLTHWMVATSIIATYLAIKGSDNIEADKAKLVEIIQAAPANVIVATYTTPANIKAVQTNIKIHYTEAITRGLLEAEGIKETAEDRLKGAQRRNAAAEQMIASKRAEESTINKAQRTIARMVHDRRERQKAAAEKTRKEKIATLVAKRRATADASASAKPDASSGPSAGSGQPTITSLWLGAKGGKRNTKKRSNKKKKTKKHKKKQHRKTKRG